MKSHYTRRAALKFGGGGGLLGFLTGFGQKPLEYSPSLRPNKLIRAIEETPLSKGEKAYESFIRLYRRNSEYISSDNIKAIDMDISVLKSVSPAMKLYIQRQRHFERQNFVSKIREFCGVEDTHDEWW